MLIALVQGMGSVQGISSVLRRALNQGVHLEQGVRLEQGPLCKISNIIDKITFQKGTLARS